MTAKANLSPEACVAEDAITQAVMLERNGRWTQEHRDALDACTREGDREGVALARHRTFLRRGPGRRPPSIGIAPVVAFDAVPLNLRLQKMPTSGRASVSRSAGFAFGA